MQHADPARPQCTYPPARSIVRDSGSRASCRSGYPDRATREQMDRQQHDPDQEQNPGNLDRHRVHSGQMQGAGNQADHQKHECLLEHGSLLSMESDVSRRVLWRRAGVLARTAERDRKPP